MSDLAVGADTMERLKALAAVLLPGTEDMPSVFEIPGFDAMLRRSVGACGYDDARLRAAFDALPAAIDWEGAQALASDHADQFHVLSTLASAAYYAAPPVLAKLGIPVERQFPAGIEEFVEEYESGILDPVIERGQRYRDVVDA